MAAKLADAFMRQAREILARNPSLVHRWDQRGNNHELIFPTLEPTGFDVVVSIMPNEVVVSARGAHKHIQPIDGQEVETTAAEALGMVRNLLSPDMRIREFCAAGSPYRWDMEINTPDGWKATDSTGLIFWNYFGRRSQQIFQNHTLPSRLGAATS